MTVEEMHYDFKIKFNKLDSNDYRDFQVPEIDWLLNEAQELFLKQRYGINNTTQQGFEGSQKRIDDLRNLVMKNISLPASQVVADPVSYEATLPADYIFAIRVQSIASKPSCSEESKKLICKPTQHDDLSNCLLDPNYNPSFEWGEMPIVYGTLSNLTADANRIFGYTDGSFTVTSFILDYLREPKRIAFPTGVPGLIYNYPDGSAVATDQDCELPEHTHREIVDIATLIAAGDINHPGYQVRMAKIGMNE